jgi:hypothetical protein
LVRLNQRFACSIITSTHSTSLLSALGQHGNENVGIIYLDKDKDEQNTIKFNSYLKTLSTLLGGHTLMGPLFNVPLLLVEGDDDYRTWSEVPRHGNALISVIPCNGDEIRKYQQTLEKILGSILDPSGTPSGYVLLDGDKPLPQQNQNFIKYVKLSCHENENLYISDECLKELGYENWDDASNKVINESHRHGEKEKLLRNIKTMDRKNGDFKKIIMEIAEILDIQELNWAYRLGKIIGKGKPQGQLADFLGIDLVNTLWPK